MSLSDRQKGKVKLGQLDLEGALIARDRVGIQDFVLLDAHNSETAFLDNLKKRYSEDLIYVREKSTPKSKNEKNTPSISLYNLYPFHTLL